MPRGIPKSGVRKPLSPENRERMKAHLLRIRAKRHPYVTDQQYQERLKARVVVDDNGCWIFQGFKHRNGYGDMCYRGENWRVHRMSFHIFKGPIPEGHDVCHTCDVRACVNPNHLWTGPRQDNNRDTRNKGRDNNSQKTHCPRGHAYAEHGEFRDYVGYKGWRNCRLCQLGRNRVKAGLAGGSSVLTASDQARAQTIQQAMEARR